MARTSKYTQSVALVSDDMVHAATIVAKITSFLTVEFFSWADFKPSSVQPFDVIIFDVDLNNGKNIPALKSYYSNSKKRKNIVFAFGQGNRKLEAQFHALGGLHHIAKPLKAEQVLAKSAELGVIGAGKRNRPDQSDGPTDVEKSSDGCLAVVDLMDSIVVAARKGGPLPVADVKSSGKTVVETLQSVDMATWLKTVHSHSSATYRHVMIVTGLAAAFVNKYNFSAEDKERVTVGALLHDIGKVKIPQKILEKPEKLTDEELKRVRQHPIDGANMLLGHKNLDDEVLMIARSHHEFLDGSGYPDGLTADEIPDIVRLVTIADVFADHVGVHPGKKALSPEDAYDRLVKMGAKLDQDIVRAFEPIALDTESDLLIKVITASAA